MMHTHAPCTVSCEAGSRCQNLHGTAVPVSPEPERTSLSDLVGADLSLHLAIALPATVVPEKAKAEMKEGILTVTLPKAK